MPEDEVEDDEEEEPPACPLEEPRDMPENWLNLFKKMDLLEVLAYSI